MLLNIFTISIFYIEIDISTYIDVDGIQIIFSNEYRLIILNKFNMYNVPFFMYFSSSIG